MLRKTIRTARRIKRELDYFVMRNWVTMLIGLIITIREVDRQYYLRGYLAYGGEWLILPMMLIVKQFIELGVWEFCNARNKSVRYQQRNSRRSVRRQKKSA